MQDHDTLLAQLTAVRKRYGAVVALDGIDLEVRPGEVLALLGEGQSAGEIAAQLHLSPGTVRNYLSEAIGKLGIGNRIEADRLARQKGWL